ncbi:class I SAM-dependent methyltransferase [Winogradskyella sp. SYSU M77433]|uniref:O-methyltransferase n=1 Tax=Winogradskyella sp. SYSU M77433 TaxID=3042722 RepID=UPI0024805A71|nr:class I SAM-dependent methyltransferase [Winogradskyella sp. SYSU M77433]MDH7913015.1 class I SAM-dependent methyltransferase [Winogradskyella sp. SYSU M77433]
MYQLISYIKFLFTATNQHGVHSPFVYEFVTKCLYDKKKYEAYSKLKYYRNILKTSKVELDITDLGEGSKVLDSKKRKVSAMVKTSSSSKKEAELLFRISKYFNFKNVLELGTSLGVGTYAFALGNENSKIITVEGCKNTSSYTESQLNKLKVKNVSFKSESFSSEIKNLDQDNFDCIYFDGHHNKKATIKYFESLLPKAHNDSVFIFDDIYWSKGMSEAWEYIKNHNSVSVTVDCFHLGFVFFRREQVEEHFKIRL